AGRGGPPVLAARGAPGCSAGHGARSGVSIAGRLPGVPAPVIIRVARPTGISPHRRPGCARQNCGRRKNFELRWHRYLREAYKRTTERRTRMSTVYNPSAFRAWRSPRFLSPHFREEDGMTQVGTGEYKYELIRDFCKLSAGQSFGLVSRVAADAQDRIYVFQRKDPPVVVFDREGKYLGAWGSGEVTDPHGLKIVGDVVYTTDRSDSVVKSFTLDGKVLLELGKRGVHSDTGHINNWLAERAAGPFNHPTEMMAHPNGDIYVSDGYRNARVHRFTRDGRLVKSWGEPGRGAGQFHLPHSIAFDDDGRLYVA